MFVGFWFDLVLVVLCGGSGGWVDVVWFWCVGLGFCFCVWGLGWVGGLCGCVCFGCCEVFEVREVGVLRGGWVFFGNSFILELCGDLGVIGKVLVKIFFFLKRN